MGFQGEEVLTDRFGRRHDYLRISLTDACNFRCAYCMPDEHYSFMPKESLMQVDEIRALAEIFVSLGVRKIRLTGGEPLARPDFPQILRALQSLPVELLLTTNGSLVHRHLNTLKASGMRSINVSLDTLNAERFAAMTRRDQFGRVWDNIQLLLQEGFRVKINAVAIKGQIEDELCDFVALTKAYPLHVRFIEFMPFAGNGWDSRQVLSAGQMLSLISLQYPVEKLSDEPHATARKYRVPGHAGTFAFITTMSDHFCGDCNRLRLTAEGKVKNCLFGSEEIDLLGPLRRGEDLHHLIAASVQAKHAAMGGQFSLEGLAEPAGDLVNRSMIAIGG